MNSHELGTIQIVRPVIHLKVRPDGSNLEDVLNKLVSTTTDSAQQPEKQAEQPPKAESAAKKPLTFVFQLVDGTILADDVATGRQWRLQNVNGQYDERGAS